MKNAGETMTTLTGEELQRIADTDHVQCGDAAAMARELLAYREASKKVFVITTEQEMLHVRHGSNGYIMDACRTADFERKGDTVIPLYIALPPHAVAVPPIAKGITPYCAGWNDCRDAMLKTHK